MPLNCSYGFASFGATKNLPAKISVIPSTTATTEGGSVNFTVVTQNLPSPFTYYWAVSGLTGTVDGTDFSTDSWGTYNDSNNTAVSGNISLALGHQTGTNKTFYYAVKVYSTNSRTISTSTAITIISPLYTSVTVDNNLMYEGQGTSTFTVNTSGCINGTVLYYTARATVGSISASSFSTLATTGQTFTTLGANTWTCPAGVYSINVVCVGGGAGGASYYGGGGGGGALAWKNNIAVVPGTVYNLFVGGGGGAGVYPAYAGNGAASSFTAGFGTISAGGGRAPTGNTFGSGSIGGLGGTPSGTYDGGGNGGAGGTNAGGGPTIAAGGGGAGGYSGNGGIGIGTLSNNAIVAAGDGSGGGGGGGSSLTVNNNASDLSAGGGGGVGLLGPGTSGSAGIQGSTTSRGGFGGSGGGDGVSVTSTSQGGTGGTYGGGGGSNGGSGSSPGQGSNGITGNGGQGAVRISWTVGTTTAPTYGSFTVNNNVGTFSFGSAAEDGNNTDDTYVVDIRTDSTSGPVVKTSPTVKMVDLTTYNTLYTAYSNELTNKFGGKGIGVTLFGGGTGQTTTATFQGAVLTANPGGNATASAVGAGGTASGGDVNVTGGPGIQNGIASGGTSSGGSGGSAGGNNAGGFAGTSWPDGLDTNGLFAALSALGYVTVSTSYTAPNVQNILKGGRGGNNTQNVTSESGFNGTYGGGGGGGGTTGKTGGNLTFGGGGGGPVVVFQYTTNGTVTGRVIRTPGAGWNNGFLETIPNGVNVVRVWIIGQGGGGYQGNNVTFVGGKGGGGGGISSKTWTWTTPTAPTKPTLA